MVKNFSAAEYEQEVMKAEGTVLVDFYADWCGPCKMQGPIVDQLTEEETMSSSARSTLMMAVAIAMKLGIKHSYHHGC